MLCIFNIILTSSPEFVTRWVTRNCNEVPVCDSTFSQKCQDVMRPRLEQPEMRPTCKPPEQWPSGRMQQRPSTTNTQTMETVTDKTESRPSANPTYANTHSFITRTPTVPFDFAPPCPLMVEPTESFRIRLLGGRTLDRRKWCWSWHGAEGSVEVCWLEPGPVRFGGEAGRTEAEPGLRPVADGLRISTPSSPFVLRSSLACSALSSSSQPSGFLDGILLPSTPIPSLEPGVMLPQHIHGKLVTLGAKRCEKLTSKDDVHCLSTWPPLFVSNPFSSPDKTTPKIIIKPDNRNSI